MNIYDKTTTDEEDQSLISYTNFAYMSAVSMENFTPI